MARPLRLQFAGALYHITARGNGREDIYLSDDDRAMFLVVLAQVYERFNWRIHAYCLMNNHYHLLVETPDGNLSQGMRQLNGVYTQRFNRAHNRVGHVFQGRFKGILVEKGAYLLELSRYIVLNPVRAGMVKTPDEWAWSSYRAMVGLEAAPNWLKTRTVLAGFGASKKRKAIQRYGAFVAEGVGKPSPWEQLKNQVYLGSDRFIEKMHKKIPKGQDLREVPQARRRKAAESLETYENGHASRNAAIRAAYASGGYTQKEIGDYFSLHYSRISKIIRQDERKK
jgi:REP element-mobilizing transposase RayT